MKSSREIAKYFSIALLVLLYIDNTFAEEEKKPFVIYQSLGYAGTPDLSKKYGIDYIKIYGAAHFYHNVLSEKIPDAERIKKWASSSEAAKDKVVVLDIEHWPLYGLPQQETEKNINKYITVAKQFSQYAPHVKFGYYGTLPNRNYRDPNRVKKGLPNSLEKWKTENKKLSSLAQNVNIIMPSLYTFENEPDDWISYAISNIEEAKQYGKPVYVFLWPEYYQANLSGKRRYIDEDFFYLQLMTVYKHADGLILWSPKSTPVKYWRESDGWWKALVQFLQDIDYIGMKPNAPTIIKTEH